MRVAIAAAMVLLGWWGAGARRTAVRGEVELRVCPRSGGVGQHALHDVHRRGQAFEWGKPPARGPKPSMLHPPSHSLALEPAPVWPGPTLGVRVSPAAYCLGTAIRPQGCAAAGAHARTRGDDAAPAALSWRARARALAVPTPHLAAAATASSNSRVHAAAALHSTQLFASSCCDPPLLRPLTRRPA